MKISRFEHEFVSTIPETLTDGKLYISLKYNSVMHLCACGCREEVSTPLSPNDWQLTYDGKSVSMHPSIGNWSYRCRSHYWIQDGEVQWAEQWSDAQIRYARAAQSRPATNETPKASTRPQKQTEVKKKRFGWFRQRFSRFLLM